MISTSLSRWLLTLCFIWLVLSEPAWGETIILRRGLAATWAASNPILAAGEPGYATDTSALKIGDGMRNWSALPVYGSGGGAGTWGSITGTLTAQLDLAAALAGLAPIAHTQAWSSITLTPTTLQGYGIADAVASTDARLSDARTPTAHQHAGIDITSGLVGAARLGSGTADASTYLRGDQTWASVAGGGATQAFGTLAVSGQTSGQTNIVADAAPDTLTLVAGTNVQITTDPVADGLTVSAVHNHTGIYDPSGTAASAVAAHAGTGGTAHANAIAAGAAGFMTGADKTKLDGIAAGATVEGATGDAFATSHLSAFNHALIASALQPAAVGVSVQGYSAALTTWAGTSPAAFATAAQGIDARTPTSHSATHALGGADPALLAGTYALTDLGNIGDATLPANGTVYTGTVTTSGTLTISRPAAGVRVTTLFLSGDGTHELAVGGVQKWPGGTPFGLKPAIGELWPITIICAPTWCTISTRSYY